MSFNPQRPHRRYNPLLNEWVLVSPHRTQRPWQGKVEPPVPRTVDPNCYLCPGNLRANGERNPNYTSTFVFDNDYAALSPQDDAGEWNAGLFRAEQVRGLCRVLVYHPNHLAHLADLTAEEMRAVIDMWQDQYRDLGGLGWVRWVQIFENRGEMMGASNPHPHGQVWASNFMPSVPERMDESLRRYREKHGVNLLEELAQKEDEAKERVVLQNPHWMVVVPFWAVWPFETLVLPRFSISHLGMLQADQKESLGNILQQLIRTYDQVFQCPFPYSMGIYQAPANTDHTEHWGLFWAFAPPLLRSATVRKFMVGYEIFAQAQRDITPELAAQRLRECAAVL